MRARCPRIDTKDAAVEPAGPPPTITTSNSSTFNLRPARWMRSVLGATIPSSWLGVFIVIGGYGNGEPSPTQGDAGRAAPARARVGGQRTRCLPVLNGPCLTPEQRGARVGSIPGDRAGTQGQLNERASRPLVPSGCPPSADIRHGRRGDHRLRSSKEDPRGRS